MKKRSWQRKIKPFMETGYVAVDMVAACINHAERFNRTVSVVRLNGNYWNLFKDSVKRICESSEQPYDDKDGYIMFEEVKVMRGSIFQLKRLEYDLIPLPVPAPCMN